MRPRPACAWAVLCLLVLLPAPASAHADEDPDHAHARIVLGDTPETEESEPRDLLRFTLQGARPVETLAGAAVVRMPLPADAMLVRFGPPDAVGEIHTDADADGTTWAFFTWSSGAPPEGTNVTNVTLVAERIVDASEDPRVVWETYTPELSVYIEVPSGFLLVSGSTLHPAIHDVPDGRRAWQQVDLASERLDVIIRPAFEGENPASSVPPSRIGGFVVLFLVGILSGGVWVGTKKLERLAQGPKEE